jgi:hypothetical protein
MLEIHRDNSPFAIGKHKGGGSSASLINYGADFKSCGVRTGVLIRNTTDGSEGLITSVSEDAIGVTLAGGTNNYWSYDDSYEIYLTATYNSVISRIGVDRSRGWKTDRKDLEDGWRPEDIDLDANVKDVFGPGQPIKDKA